MVYEHFLKFIWGLFYLPNFKCGQVVIHKFAKVTSSEYKKLDRRRKEMRRFRCFDDDVLNPSDQIDQKVRVKQLF